MAASLLQGRVPADGISGAVNYYEELGLTARASTDEIRRAYKGLSRLLHPDQQADESLRRLAESQMKRLNVIHDTLTDPVKRRRYDLDLSAEAGPSSRVVPVVVTPAGKHPGRDAYRLGLSAGAWLLIAMAAAGTLFYALGNRPAGDNPTHTSPAAVSDSAARSNRTLPHPARDPGRPLAAIAGGSSRELLELRRQLEAARAERDSAREELAMLAAAQPKAIPPPSPADAEVSSVQPVDPFPHASTSSPSPPEQAGASPASPYAGTWFYARPKIQPLSAVLYPPVFIETVVTEEDGVLHGRYRARYQVADRAISPEVLFSFSGKVQGNPAVLGWTGVGGAKGEVRLRLLSGDSMEVDWTALELGGQMGLVSGTAVLIRRRQP